MSAVAKLPVSALLPTRNSIALLRNHLEAAREWLPLMQELVVVDSDSTDGTIEFLRENLKGAPARFLKHPPGLYESWNFGVAQCSAKYVYISTVGDSVSPAGLQRLVEVAEHFQCDVVISPPRLINDHGAAVKKVFPIHDAVTRLRLTGPSVLEGPLALLLAVIYMRKAILGSSASNLYRVETLRRLPFPTNFGHAGDVGWGLKYAGQTRIGILPETHSTFQFHRRSYKKKSADDLGRRRVAVARESIESISTVPQELGSQLALLCDAWLTTVETSDALAAAKNSAAWFLKPEAWCLHSARGKAFAQLAEAQNQALTLIASSLASSVARADA